jgi:hypothetical protein
MDFYETISKNNYFTWEFMKKTDYFNILFLTLYSSQNITLYYNLYTLIGNWANWALDKIS